MQAQDGLNEELLDDGQAARILGDLNAHVVFNRAAINHINSFTRDDLLDKKNRSMVNFWTKLSRLGQRHIPRFRSKVLRNTRRMLFVNLSQDEVCFGLTLFVWLTRMHHPFKHASAHIWRWSRGKGTKTHQIVSITASKKRVEILSTARIVWETALIVPATELWDPTWCGTFKRSTRSR